MNKIEIKKIRKKLELTQTEFGKMLGVGLRSVQSWEKGINKMSDSTQILLKNILRDKSWNNNLNTVNESLENYDINKGVPYYDLDFSVEFLEIINNQDIQPDYYINDPYFKGCDYVVKTYCNSMTKIIKFGDAVGIVKIENWKDFLPMGEIYAIVSKNNFRLIRAIIPGPSEDEFTLVSKPENKAAEEFPPQIISKDLILSIYKVKALSRLC